MLGALLIRMESFQLVDPESFEVINKSFNVVGGLPKRSGDLAH